MAGTDGSVARSTGAARDGRVLGAMQSGRRRGAVPGCSATRRSSSGQRYATIWRPPIRACAGILSWPRWWRRPRGRRARARKGLTIPDATVRRSDGAGSGGGGLAVGSGEPAHHGVAVTRARHGEHHGEPTPPQRRDRRNRVVVNVGDGSTATRPRIRERGTPLAGAQPAGIARGREARVARAAHRRRRTNTSSTQTTNLQVSGANSPWPRPPRAEEARPG